MCTSLTSPSNGLISYGPDTTSPFNYQTTATYSCNAGYGLSGGDRTRQCVSFGSGDGGWSGTAPTCEGICNTLNYKSAYFYLFQESFAPSHLLLPMDDMFSQIHPFPLVQ